MISIEKDKQFSLMQREKERPGCMLGIYKNFLEKEKRIKLVILIHSKFTLNALYDVYCIT